MEITIHNPSNLPLIDYRNVKPLQGKLKRLSPENHAKLKNILLKRGFRVPLFVWRQVADGQVIDWLMDGHGRQKVMTAENMTPYDVPYVLIEAANLEEAKAQLLEITSQYQVITKKGLTEFALDLEAVDFENAVFDAFDMNATTPVRRNQGKSIVITFGDDTELESCLADVQEICERYSSAQIKVNE